MDNAIFKKVQETLAGALGVEASEVVPEASLKRDLGAESIDFIDIIFRLEKSFDLKIPANDLFPSHIFTDERFVREGMVTPEESMNFARLPYLELGDFERDPQVSKLADYFTVKMILRYLEEKLGKSSGCSDTCQS